MDKKREQFLENLCEIADYWKDKENATFGAIFSVLVMLDGDSALNNFERIEIKGISNNNELHNDFCIIRNNREKTK